MKTLHIMMILSGILLCCSEMAFAQEKYTISGTVADAETGEKLVGASVFEKETKNGAMANTSGFYSLTLIKGTHTITYAFVGYKKLEEAIELDRNITLNVKLSP